ncbi:MAG: hypothetical protein JST39_09115, partial [Bacteroidetes bacterium]|nr:hypothetical protein [Bacteroidota bacterium]
PVVEEQPYDRFYKKPVVPARGTPLPQNIIEPVYQPESAAAAASSSPAESPRPAFSPSAASMGRHIHVTLPSGSRLNVTAVSSRSNASVPAAAENAPAKDAEDIHAAYKPSSPAAPEKTFATTLASQPRFAPVDERLDNGAYAAAQENVYPVSHTNASSGYSWTTLMGMVVGIATLVGLGIMIGLSMNRSKPAANTVALQLAEHPKPAAQPENNNVKPQGDNSAANGADIATPAVNNQPVNSSENNSVPVRQAVQQQPAGNTVQPVANKSQAAGNNADRQADVKALQQQGITVKNLHVPGDKLSENAMSSTREKVTAPPKKDTKPGEPRLAQKRADVLPSAANATRVADPVTVRPNTS